MPCLYRRNACVSWKSGTTSGNFSRLDYLQAKVDFNADSAQYMKQREVLNSSRIKLNELMANHDVTALIGIRDTAIDVNPDLQYDEIMASHIGHQRSLLMADNNTEVVRATIRKSCPATILTYV